MAFNLDVDYSLLGLENTLDRYYANRKAAVQDAVMMQELRAMKREQELNERFRQTVSAVMSGKKTAKEAAAEVPSKAGELLKIGNRVQLNSIAEKMSDPNISDKEYNSLAAQAAVLIGSQPATRKGEEGPGNLIEYIYAAQKDPSLRPGLELAIQLEREKRDKEEGGAKYKASEYTAADAKEVAAYLNNISDETVGLDSGLTGKWLEEIKNKDRFVADIAARERELMSQEAGVNQTDARQQALQEALAGIKKNDSMLSTDKYVYNPSGGVAPPSAPEASVSSGETVQDKINKDEFFKQFKTYDKNASEERMEQAYQNYLKSKE